MVDPLGGLPYGPAGPSMNDPGIDTPASSPREPTVPGGSFLDLLKQSVNEVNNMQSAAGDKVQKLVTGEISSIHEVMIATEEASIAFNLLMQVRNQLVRAWDEIRRMPV